MLANSQRYNVRVAISSDNKGLYSFAYMTTFIKDEEYVCTDDGSPDFIISNDCKREDRFCITDVTYDEALSVMDKVTDFTIFYA